MVYIDPVADAADVVVLDTSGIGGEPIGLDIIAAVVDLDGSETISKVVISDVPADATLSAGVKNLDGTWTLQADELIGLTFTGVGENIDIPLTVTVHVKDVDPDSGIVSEIATSEILTVSLTDGLDGPAPINDDPLDPNDPNSDGDPLTARGEGDEDTAIALDLGPITALDPNETFSDVTLSGVPAGAVISAGTDNGDGTWTVPATQLAGLRLRHRLMPSEDFTSPQVWCSTKTVLSKPSAVRSRWW